MTRWAIFTGEYPPQPGGVSDYVRLVANRLYEAGDDVDVYAPEYQGRVAADASGLGPRINRLSGGFGFRGFMALNHMLDANPPDRALIQYVPHAFGCKAMNLPFAYWVQVSLRRRAPVWVMFHEVAFPFSYFPLRHAILGKVTGHMAAQIAAASERIFISIPAWEPRLRNLQPSLPTVEWLPIPSLVTCPSNPGLAGDVRRKYAPNNTKLIGHFGTFPANIARILLPVLAKTLELDANVSALLFGRASTTFRDQFVEKFPAIKGRVQATGEIPADQVISHMLACDLLVQPYPDGVSSRRSSIMPALANGIPVVTNLGALSESLWADGGVAAVETPDPDLIAVKCVELLADASSRLQIGEDGRTLYQSTYTIERTIATLRGVR